jgi:FixJ family two-component response regulator
MPYRTLPALALTEAERTTLTQWTRRATTAQALALRARIVLAAATGAHNTAIARRLGITKPTVGKWRAAVRAPPARRAAR